MKNYDDETSLPRDYCTGSPDTVDGIFIGRCCKYHDNAVGQAGTYNPITPHIAFYKCLKSKGLKYKYVVLYTIGGVIFSLYKYPWLAYRKYIYRKQHTK